MKENANRQYRQIVKYTGYFGGVQGLNILAALVRNKVVAVLLGPIGLGLISLYNTAVKLIGDTTNLGIPVSAVRYLSECQEEQGRCRMVATVRLWSLLTAALGAVVCCVLVPFFRLFYFSTEMRFAEFLWLVPVVALTAVTAGELSILKGLQRMREVATQSVVNAMLSLVVTLPLFWLFGNEGILPALVAAAVAASVTVLWFSLRVYPYRLPRSFRQAISAGGGMVRLGVAFVIAGAMGSGVEFAVRAFIANSGTLADVGLYNAGYVVTVTYASIVFMSMETEYFPRLSAVNHDEEACNATVNRQIEVCTAACGVYAVASVCHPPSVLIDVFAGTWDDTIRSGGYAATGRDASDGIHVACQRPAMDLSADRGRLRHSGCGSRSGRLQPVGHRRRRRRTSCGGGVQLCDRFRGVPALLQI